MESDAASPRARWWLDAVVIVGAMLLMGSIAGWRMVHLPMWGDEVRTWRDSVGKSYREILTWTHNHDHAPLGHLLTKVSADVFHTTEPWALRLPAFLFGLAIIPLAYLLGRIAAGRLAALLIVVMVCVDITITTQAHQARMYTQFLAWTLAALCCAAAILRDTRHLAVRTLLLGLFLGLSIWTHFAAMALVIATLITGIILLFRRDDRRCGAALLAGVGIAGLIAVQGMIKLVGMRGRAPLPKASDSDPFEQLMDACKGLMGNAPLCILLFFLAAGGLYLLFKQQRRFAILLIASIVVGIGNLFVASMYRQIEGQRYLLGFLPAAWIGLGVINAAMLTHRNRAWSRIFLVLFILGTAYQLSRTLRSEPHPLAYPVRDVAHTLPSLGYTADQTLVFAPAEPMRMGARFYGLQHEADLYEKRVLPAMKSGRASPRFIGRDRPPVLWMVVVTPCRTSQQKTEQDGLATAQAAAAFYTQPLDANQLPHDTDLREVSILRLTPTSIDIWKPNGERR
jgi:hypothetical protein